MSKYVNRFFAFFLAASMLAVSVIPSHADILDGGKYYISNLWDFVTFNDFDFGARFWNNLTGYFAGEECPSSPDSYHHGPTPEFGSRTGGTDESGRYTWVTCDYCRNQFKAYSSFTPGHGGGFSSDLQQSYNSQLSALPATGYNSSGNLIWQPTFADYYMGYVMNYSSQLLDIQDIPNRDTLVSYSFSDSYTKTISEFQYRNWVSGFPIPGSYRRMNTIASQLRVLSDGVSYDYSLDFSVSSWVHRESYSVDDFTLKQSVGLSKVTYLSCLIYTPVYEVIPDSFVDFSPGDIYNINSRAASISGDYGIIGDNGQITKIEGNTIVNETNNTIFNPATGETHTLSDWSYNYVDRSYTATTQSGDTITVTYGDENITIVEGNNTYTVYYIIQGSDTGGTPDPGPGPDPGEDPCNHHWGETSSTPATCTVNGSRLLTCSLCGETKTETIPATGHNWYIKQSVNTEYDDSGGLIQEGYTIWECSICGQQYKTTDESSPPSSVPGSGSSSGIFSGIFGLLLDFLSFFWHTFRDFVGEGVKSFLEALKDGTSSFFGLLNPFNWGD